MTFDSLHYANQLKSVGVPEKQAEMQAILEKKNRLIVSMDLLMIVLQLSRI